MRTFVQRCALQVLTLVTDDVMYFYSNEIKLPTVYSTVPLSYFAGHCTLS